MHRKVGLIWSAEGYGKNGVAYNCTGCMSTHEVVGSVKMESDNEVAGYCSVSHMQLDGAKAPISHSSSKASVLSCLKLPACLYINQMLNLVPGFCTFCSNFSTSGFTISACLTLTKQASCAVFFSIESLFHYIFICFGEGLYLMLLQNLSVTIYIECHYVDQSLVIHHWLHGID